MRTLLDMRQQVINDLDLDEETFITTADLNLWINKGIRKAEQQIHTLYEDYFLNETTVSINKGDYLIDYPSDIYANKIRQIIYTDNTLGSNTSHVVKRVKSLIDGTDMDLYVSDSALPTLKWSPVNDATEGRKIRLFPFTGRSGQLKIWYIRNARQLVNDTDVCDIDEFEDFVVQHCKTMAYSKDGDPRVEESVVMEEQMKEDMMKTLSDMVPDNDNELDKDFSLYEDMVGDNL